MSGPERGKAKDEFLTEVRRRRERHERHQREGDASFWSSVGMMGSIGWSIMVPLTAGVLFGRWLDGLLNTKPWMTIVFALFGIAAGFINLFRITAQAERAEKEIARLEAAEDAKTDDDPNTTD